jgi:sigma-B regulation protein RsbU (phosphoserine phosphatase)
MPTDVEQLRHLLAVYKGLVDVSALINAISDFDELLPAILDVARRVMHAEASSLFLLNKEGDLELTVATNSQGEVAAPKIVVPRGRGIAGWVLENRKSLLVPDAYADPRFYTEADKSSGFKTRSILCVPLVHETTQIGVLQVLNPIGKEAFDDADLEAFEAYAHLASTAIDKLRAFERQREQERVERELTLAGEIQQSFLPKSLPKHSGIEFAAAYRPARNVGGDFYDVVAAGADAIYFVIGDVSGKGIPAALLMAQALSMLRPMIEPESQPAAVLKRWNNMLCTQTIRGMFITAILGRVIPSQHRVEIASAGHCQPLRVSRGNEITEVKCESAPPLGILPGIEYRMTAATLAPGEWLAFYTDGLVESFNAERAELGKEGVVKLLRGKFDSANNVAETLARGESNHRGEAEPHDDMTLLVFGFR